MHIDNLYKNQEILMLKECYAMEKIHGTSAHIAHKVDGQGFNQLNFFAGGCKHERFVNLFDQEELADKMRGLNATVYGEAYGASLLKMRETYGEDLRFVAFDVKIDDCWLSVPQAEAFVLDLGLEFVDYVKIPTTLEAIDAQRDRPSTQAIRNGMGDDKEREGVVLRPLIELTKNNGGRIMCKHKRDKFMETKTPRKVDPEKLKILADAQAVAEEWVTPMRVVHVLDKIEDPCMEKMKQIISAMLEDVKREGEGEIEWSQPVSKAIGKATALAVKAYFQAQLAESQV
jgi:hypothetical protein